MKTLTSALLLGSALLLAAPATAADLGGNCCADLEERIAELEATAARKGNRKVSLRVYGQVSKALFYISGDGDEETHIIENSNAESFVGFAGEAKFATNWSAGYVLEIGVGGTEDDLFNPADANGLYTRRSFVFVDSPVGQVALGRNSQATDEISQISIANTTVAARMLSLRPLNGPEAGEVLDLWDGSRTNVVRYDSPVLSGFKVSASWAQGDETFLTSGDVWDVALRYAGEFGGFRVAGGIGYRQGLTIPSVADIGGIFGEDIETWSGSASIMHTASGLFLNGAYGVLSVGPADLVGWHGQGGIERKWSELGSTTLFAEYAKTDEDIEGLKLYGAGLVQHIEAAAFDLYGTVRRIEIGDEEATTVMVGARAKF